MILLCGHMHMVHTSVVEPSTVLCLAKVPAVGSILAIFEVLDNVVDGGDNDDGESLNYTTSNRRQG